MITARLDESGWTGEYDSPKTGNTRVCGHHNHPTRASAVACAEYRRAKVASGERT
jgi:hypothetical protein